MVTEKAVLSTRLTLSHMPSVVGSNHKDGQFLTVQ